MMSSAPRFQPVSVHDYLDGECHAGRKHEYVDGIIYAMVGGTVAHSRIASNAMIALGSQLRGQPCQVFNSDIKIRVQPFSGTRFYYPDVSVVCHPNPASDLYHDAPAVIIEIVSESTRRVDELEKRDAYLSIDSLRAYLLVEQTATAVLVYRRGDQGFHREAYTDLDAVIELPEIGCTLALVDLYENAGLKPLTSDE